MATAKVEMELVTKVFLCKDMEYEGNGILELVPANMVIPTKKKIQASTLIELRRYLHAIERSTRFTAKLDIEGVQEGPTESSIVLSENLVKVLSSLEGAMVTVKVSRSDLISTELCLPFERFTDEAVFSGETRSYIYTNPDLPSARGRPSTVDCYFSWHNEEIYLNTDELQLPKLIEKNAPPDMEIAVIGEVIKCHRIVWEAHNLTSIFGEQEPRQILRVKLPKMSPECLNVLLPALYHRRDGFDLRKLPISTMYKVYEAAMEYRLPDIARDIKALFMGTEPMDHLPYFVWAFYHKTRVYENLWNRNPFENEELQTYCLRIFKEINPDQMEDDPDFEKLRSTGDLNLQQFMDKSAAFEI